MDQIIFKSFGNKDISVAIGRRQGIHREQGDVCLSRQVAIGLPLRAYILIRADGEIAMWDVDWDHVNDNYYWQFDCGSDEYAFGGGAYPDANVPTEQQREAIAKLFFHEDLAGGLGGWMGRSPQQWCKFSGIDELEKLGQPKQKAYYA